MSHIATVELRIKSLSALKAAIEALGGQLNEEQKTYRHYYGEKACDAAITHPNAKYGIGVIQQQDGTYTMECDEWSTGGLKQVFGAGLNAIRQRYAAVVAGLKMRQQGWRVREQQQENGTLQLVCTR